MPFFTNLGYNFKYELSMNTVNGLENHSFPKPDLYKM